MKKLNILQLITGLGKGGAEKVLYELCQNLDRDSIRVTILAFGERDDLLEVFIKSGIKTDFFYIKSKWSTLSFAKFLWNKVRKEDIDIVHAHLFHAMIFAVIAKVFSPKIKLVFTLHSSNLESFFRELMVFLLRPIRLVDIIFSKDQKRYYDKNNAVVIENGIDSASYLLNEQKNDCFTFINVARLEEVKNHSGLIKIVKKLAEQTDIPFCVQIVGEGHLRESLENEAQAEGVADKIQFLGWRTDIKQLCSKAHAFVLPSLWEGLPIALLEAGACALPVITTPVGSIPSVINEGNGFLATEDVFAQQMLYVMSHYEVAAKKGNALQRDIQIKYDVKVMVAKHQQLYQKALQGHV